MARAADAGLAGTYVAYLATSTTPATSRLAGSRGWSRVDGKPFGDRIEDIIAGKIYYPPSLDEHGANVGMVGPGATGAAADGVSSGLNCGDFADPTARISTGIPYGTVGAWSSHSDQPCATVARLYCFGLGKNQPPVITPAQGRIAFLSSQTYLPGTGVAGGDAICMEDAASGGSALAGKSFKALLNTSTASAASRFSLAGPNWVRIDGIPLASSPLAFMNGDLDTTLNVTVIPSYENNNVFIGGNPLTNTANAVNETCQDWTVSADSALTGAVHRTDMLTGQTGQQCSPGKPVLCLEE
jgi:hypothetical protein